MAWAAETPEGVVTFSDGLLSGSRFATLAIEAELFRVDSIAVTPTGPFVQRDSRDELAVLAALGVLYPARFTLSGDVPVFDDESPEGIVF